MEQLELDREITPITDPEVNRRYKICQCANCGVTKRCTPSFDYYKVMKPGTKNFGKLVCEDCLLGVNL